MRRVFANGPGDRGSILGRVIPNTQKMVLDAALLNTQHYKLRIKRKVEQSRKWSSTLPYTSVYWKGKHRVTLDYGRKLYFFFTIVLTNLHIGRLFCLFRWSRPPGRSAGKAQQSCHASRERPSRLLLALERLSLSPRAWDDPLFRGMPTRPEAFFGIDGHVWTTSLRLVPTIKKALCRIPVYVGRPTNINTSVSLCWSP